MVSAVVFECDMASSNLRKFASHPTLMRVNASETTWLTDDDFSFAFLPAFLRALTSWYFAPTCMQCSVYDACARMGAHALACKFSSKTLRPHACNVQSVTRGHVCLVVQIHACTRTIFTHWHAFFTFSRLTGQSRKKNVFFFYSAKYAVLVDNENLT